MPGNGAGKSSLGQNCNNLGRLHIFECTDQSDGLNRLQLNCKKASKGCSFYFGLLNI